MDLDYNLDTTNAVADESILIKESNLHNQTILDYRDFMARQQAKNDSVFVHQDAFIVDQGLSELTAKDLEELAHHGHSDQETDDDIDPYYEYNQC